MKNEDESNFLLRLCRSCVAAPPPKQHFDILIPPTTQDIHLSVASCVIMLTCVDEVKTVSKDPHILGGLIAEWGESKMRPRVWYS